VPASRASQRKAAHHQALLIDGIALADILQGLEDVGLSGEFVAVAKAPVGMQHEGVRRREFPRRLLPTVDEIELTQRLAASVKPKIETMRMSRARIIRGGHDQTIGLHRAVDFGKVSAHN